MPPSRTAPASWQTCTFTLPVFAVPAICVACSPGTTGLTTGLFQGGEHNGGMFSGNAPVVRMPPQARTPRFRWGVLPLHWTAGMSLHVAGGAVCGHCRALVQSAD